MKKTLQILILWGCLFLAALPTANAVLKTAPDFSTQTANIATKFEKKIHKPSRIEKWLMRRTEKQLNRLKKYKLGKYLPLDPPDDDEPAELFRYESPQSRNKNSFFAPKKHSKRGFYFFLSGLLMLLSFFLSEGENAFELALILLGVGFLFTIYSVFVEGFNWCNSAILLFILLLLV